MKDIVSVLHECAEMFERLGMPYAVMGGLAVRMYGIPRPTHDVDFTIALERDRLSDLCDSLRKLGYTVAVEYATGWVDRVAEMPLVKARMYIEDRGIDVDFFLAESPYQQQLLARRQCEELDRRRIWFVSPEDLVLLILLSHRPRYVADIADVLFTQGRLDEEYMRHWASELGVSAKLDAALAGQRREQGRSVFHFRSTGILPVAEKHRQDACATANAVTQLEQLIGPGDTKTPLLAADSAR